MTDIDKVIGGIVRCLRFCGTCEGCPYENEDAAACMEALQKDTVELLEDLKLIKRSPTKEIPENIARLSRCLNDYAVDVYLMTGKQIGKTALESELLHKKDS